jgi:hypothetical protein
MHVTAPGAAQLALPIVSPALLTRATEVARQYRTEHGTPITAGRLAVRLQVASDVAAELLALIERGPTTPTLTVNGRRAEATR